MESMGVTASRSDRPNCQQILLEELAKAVLFLASEDSSYVNAIELMVDGGLTGGRLERPFFAAVHRGSAGAPYVLVKRFTVFARLKFSIWAS